MSEILCFRAWHYNCCVKMSAPLDFVAQTLKAFNKTQAESARAYVCLTYAQSIDGCITSQRGTPTTISCPETLALTHQLRCSLDGILVGSRTIIADNPSLTVRHATGPNPQPIIVDVDLSTPLDCKLLVHPSCRRPLILTALHSGFNSEEQAARLERAGKLLALGARIAYVPCVTSRPHQVEQTQTETAGTTRHLDFLHAMRILKRDFGIRSIMVEGGSGIISSFIEQHQCLRDASSTGVGIGTGISPTAAHVSERTPTGVDVNAAPLGLIDSVLVTIAPLYLPGGLHTASVRCKPMPLRDVQWHAVGTDLVVTGTP